MNDARLLRRFRQIEQDAYRRGFEAAKAAAREIIEKHEMSTSRFGWTDFSDMLSQVESLTPEETR